MLGLKCNNKCMFCPFEKSRSRRDILPSDIKKTITESFNKNYDTIEFLGGEPTIYPQLI